MLARIESFPGFPSLWGDVDELLRPFRWSTEAVPQDLTLAADVVETDKAWEIRLDAPGVKPADIEVTLENSTLTVTAVRQVEKQDDVKSWLRQERAFGRYQRRFTLPNSVSAPGATYRNGVLIVTLPKKAEAQPRTVTVKVDQ